MVDFSVVIPAYNNLELFQRALHSIRIQKDVSVQIVVVDDSNKNNDIEDYVLSLHDDSIIYNHNRPSLGAISNWNAGLRKASGEYVILMHHDEAFANADHLKLVKDAFRKYDVVIGNIQVNRSDGKTYSIFPLWFKRFVLRMPSALFCINAIGPCAVCACKREYLEYFDERTNWFVDVEWYYRIMKRRKTVFLPEAVVTSYHGHQDQITNTIDTMREAKLDASVLRGKYRFNLAVRTAMWIQIYVLHNDILHKTLRKILGR